MTAIASEVLDSTELLTICYAHGLGAVGKGLHRRVFVFGFKQLYCRQNLVTRRLRKVIRILQMGRPPYRVLKR